jgi:membrane dipeptidase
MDERIRISRETALNILKPSKRVLERGLALHAGALVWESYGFAPRAAIDGDAARAAVEAGASETEMRALYLDMCMTRYATDAEERRWFTEAFEAAGVTCVFQNAGEECQSVKRLIERLARFTYATDVMRDFLQRATTPQDVLDAKRNKRHCLYMSGNAVPMAEDWMSVEEELRYVRVLHQLGVRMMHLTYNRRNMIGDGCSEPANAGLSDFGRAAIAEMNRAGVIVDVAHSGWQTSLEAAKASAKPVVASHSSCCGLREHIRGKPDEVIRAIADTGGYIGICCIPEFLGGSGDISAMMDHIDYAIRKFGADHVAIGTDVAYSSPNCVAEEAKLPVRADRQRRPAWESLWPPSAELNHPKWSKPEQKQSLAWTNWPLFTVGMAQRGHSDEDILKVLGGNAMRVAGAV